MAMPGQSGKSQKSCMEQPQTAAGTAREEEDGDVGRDDAFAHARALRSYVRDASGGAPVEDGDDQEQGHNDQSAPVRNQDPEQLSPGAFAARPLTAPGRAHNRDAGGGS